MEPTEGEFDLQINARRRVIGWFTNSATQQALPVRGQITRRGQLTAHIQSKLALRGIVTGTTNATVEGIILGRCVGTFQSSVPTNCCVTPTNPPPLFPDTNLSAYVSQLLGKPIEEIHPADLQSLEEIDLVNGDVRDLTGLQNATNVNWVNIAPSIVTNYSALYRLPVLRSLSIGFITNGAFLSNLTQLEYLRVENSELGDAAPLQTLTNLYQLDFDETSATNIEALANLPALGNFYHSSETVSDAKPYGSLMQLRYLRLASGQLRDIAPLAPLTNLVMISLGGFPLSNFTPGLSSMLSLQYANIVRAGMSDLEWVNLPYMSRLYLSGNLITNISPLTELKLLDTLDLSGNPITDLSPLAQMTNLTSLGVGQLGLDNLSFVAGLQNLRWLSADLNLIGDLSPLTNCTHLEFARLHYNKIADLTPLTACTNLRWVELRGNEITALPAFSSSLKLTSLALYGVAPN